MKSPLPSQDDMEIVRWLTRELAEEPSPELDWDGIERGLLAAVERPAASVHSEEAPALPPSAPAAQGWRELLGVAFAAAAMATLTIGAPQTPPAMAPAPDAQAVDLPLGHDDRGDVFEDATALGAGQVVQAKSFPVIYRATAMATWTLAPGSRARILSTAAASEPGAVGTMTISLLDGSVRAEVVHRDLGESFAVEVGKTRIAAHGTSFDVTREGDRVVVTVRHGSVAVGPAGHSGNTEGWLVVGPDRASFSLDGGRDVRWLPRPEPEAPSLPGFASRAPLAREPSLSSLPAFTARKGAPPALSMSSPMGVEIAAGEPTTSPAARAPAEGRHTVIAAILGGLEACYQRQVAGAGVEVSVESSLRLTILADGSVREGIFDPPLSPMLMSCATEEIGQARFPGGGATYRLEVPVRLSPARPSSPAP